MAPPPAGMEWQNLRSCKKKVERYGTVTLSRRSEHIIALDEDPRGARRYQEEHADLDFGGWTDLAAWD